MHEVVRELAEALADLEAVRAQPSPDGSSRPELPQGGEGDVDSAWRRQLTVRMFTSLLAEVVPWGATEAGLPIVEALKELPKVQAARRTSTPRCWRTGRGGVWCWATRCWPRAA
ncbi:hypothetical protein [Streptomyces sp. NPDC001139]